MTVEFTASTQGLRVRLMNLSSNTGSATPLWDFGDGHVSTEKNPSHIYSELGRYTITLKYLEEETVVGSMDQNIMVSDKVKTTLSDTIYTLINTYLPEEVFGEISTTLKHQLINKWQLYIGPLVDHCIHIEDYSNELYYEALENQLVMELAAYDYMVLKVNQMVQGLNTNISQKSEGSEGSDSGDGEGSIKHITTGPTEVEYFNPDEFASDAISSIIKAMNPDGIIALMRSQICMLAERLDIYLPLCQRLPAKRVVPKVVNRRVPRFMGGPDPMEALKK